MHSRRLFPTTLFITMSLLGCGSKPTDQADAALQAEATVPAKAEPSKPQSDEEKAEPAEPTESGVTPEGVPVALTGVVAFPEGSRWQKDAGNQIPSMFSLVAPPGASFGERKPDGWRGVKAGPHWLAVRSVTPTQEELAACPTLDEVKTTLSNSKIEAQYAFRTHTVEPDTDYGEIELLLFRDDGGFGFYGRKHFDQGDDYTSYCCAAGAASEAASLTTRVAESAAREMAGICMSVKFTY